MAVGRYGLEGGTHQQEDEKLAQGASTLAVVGSTMRAQTSSMTIRVSHNILHSHTAVVVYQPQMGL